MSAISAVASAMAMLCIAYHAASGQDELEAIRDRAIAFEHARICAGLVWPYWRPFVARQRLTVE